MRNFFVTVTCSLVLSIVSAQTKIGIRAGWDYGTAQVVENNIDQKARYVSGYSAGVIFKVPFEGVLHFSPSINFSHRGYAYTHSAGMVAKTENKINYIDLIPGVSFDFPTGAQSAFIIGVSPMLSIAITGKDKNTLTNNSVTTTKLIFNYSNYSRFDVGVTGNIGYKFNDKIILEAAYFYGLANLQNDESILRDIKTRMFRVTVGYYLK